MADNYRKKNSIRRNAANNGSIIGQLALMVVVFIAGYMSASLYNLSRLSDWVSTHVLDKNLAQTSTTPGVDANGQHAQLAKPKFEFYTLLANEHVAGSTQVAPATQVAAATMPVAVLPVKALPLNAPLVPVANVASSTSGISVEKVVAEKVPTEKVVEKMHALAMHNPALAMHNHESYLIQVGSFKRIVEAERMKATLAMKGFDVSVVTVSQQHTNWYRVIIGPFASKGQAQQVLVAFARREHITGMIRKMDA